MIFISGETMHDTIGKHPIRALLALIAIAWFSLVNPAAIWIPGLVLLAVLAPLWGPEPGGLFVLIVLCSPFLYPTVTVGLVCLMASRKWWVVPVGIAGVLAIKYGFAFAVWSMHGVPMEMVLAD